MGKKKDKKQKPTSVQAPHNQPIPINFDITDEPLENPDYPPVPKEVLADLERIYMVMKDHPEQAISELLELKKQFPYYPKFDNYISTAYSQIEQYDKARETVEETYKAFPKYLFARVNYAELRIQDKKYAQVPLLFEEKTGLKELYPHRTVFHISEVSGFYGIMGWYYCSIDNHVEAERHYTLLKYVNPAHQFTRRIGKYLAAPVVLHALLQALQEKQP